MKALKLTLILTSFFVLTSCGGGGGDDPKPDTTVPTITLTSPTSSTVVTAGTDLSVSGTVSDNVNLSSYVLTIAFSNTTGVVKSVEEFAFDSRSVTGLPSISGTSESLSFDVAIPEDAKPGNYLFSLKVKDASENEATKTVTFSITSP